MVKFRGRDREERLHEFELRYYYPDFRFFFIFRRNDLFSDYLYFCMFIFIFFLTYLSRTCITYYVICITRQLIWIHI